jgi:glycosyltransferase involved in cell wall biosynthesis
MIYFFKPGQAMGTGANLYYSYAAKLLFGEKNTIAFFDLNDFLENGIKKLKPNDVVVNTLSLAFLFHHFREYYGLKFRIVRDVQTSLHAGCLLQEMLVFDMIRNNDIVLFPSNFTRQLYIKLFKHINEENSFVCYPILGSFPKKIRKNAKEFKYGYICRCTPDKCFDSVIRFARMTKENILIAGESWYPRRVFPDNITYLGGIDNKKIWDFYSRIQILLFPSTANIESLGRVILEANHAKIPVISACHGASAELCKNLVDVKYYDSIELVHNHALGKIDENDFLGFKELKIGSNAFYSNHETLLKDILLLKAKKQQKMELNEKVEEFIEDSKISVNPDFRHQKIFILKTIMKYLKRGDYINLGKFSHDVNEAIDFFPRWTKKSSE